MQRFFSTFPGSWPGAGLLLLRGVVGGTATAQGVVYLAHAAGSSMASGTLGLLTAAGGAAVVAGFLTPAAGLLAGIGTVAIVIGQDPLAAPRLPIDAVAALFVLADAAALVLLGPGAHSLDAYLFGRREIVIPPVFPPGH